MIIDRLLFVYHNMLGFCYCTRLVIVFRNFVLVFVKCMHYILHLHTIGCSYTVYIYLLYINQSEIFKIVLRKVTVKGRVSTTFANSP